MLMPKDKLDPYHYRFFSEKLKTYRSDSRFEKPSIDAAFLSLQTSAQTKLLSILAPDFKSFKIRDLEDLRHIQQRHDEDLFAPAGANAPAVANSEPDEILSTASVSSVLAPNPSQEDDPGQITEQGFLKALKSLFQRKPAPVVELPTEAPPRPRRTHQAPIKPSVPQELESILAKKSLTGILAYCIDRKKTQLDWQSLADFYQQASPAAQEGIDSLFSALCDHTVAQLIEQPGAAWGKPRTVIEGETRKDILGRTYVQNENKDWIREDRFVQRYFVYGTIVTRCVAERAEVMLSSTGVTVLPTTRFQEKYQLLGTAGTLAGAIEIAATTVDHLPIKHASANTWADRMDIFEGAFATRNMVGLITAKISHDLVSVNGDEIAEARVDWDRPNLDAIDKILKNTLSLLGEEKALTSFLEDDLNL
jgi:hypothetical protein